jgi:hypothetical protein
MLLNKSSVPNSSFTPGAKVIFDIPITFTLSADVELSLNRGSREFNIAGPSGILAILYSFISIVLA